MEILSSSLTTKEAEEDDEEKAEDAENVNGRDNGDNGDVWFLNEEVNTSSTFFDFGNSDKRVNCSKKELLIGFSSDSVDSDIVGENEFFFIQTIQAVLNNKCLIGCN